MTRAWATVILVLYMFTLTWCTDDNKSASLHEVAVKYIQAVTPK